MPIGPPSFQCCTFKKVDGITPVHEVDCYALHMFVKVSKSAADHSDAKKLTVGNTITTFLWVR